MVKTIWPVQTRIQHTLKNDDDDDDGDDDNDNGDDEEQIGLNSARKTSYEGIWIIKQQTHHKQHRAQHFTSIYWR